MLLLPPIQKLNKAIVPIPTFTIHVTLNFKKRLSPARQPFMFYQGLLSILPELLSILSGPAPK